MPGNGQVSIIALNGSPHRDGNTTTLMRWVVEGCAEAGAGVGWVHLVDHQIEYCRGCFTCLRTGQCPIPDDFLPVRERLWAADGVVVGSPVYEDQPTARLKVFLDRLTLLNLYTHIFERQRTAGVATSGVAPTMGLAKGLAVFFGRHCGAIGAKTATVERGYQPLAEIHDPRLPGRARALGRRLVWVVRRPRRLRVPAPEYLWYKMLHRVVLRRLVRRNPEQFAGVLEIWREKGWLWPHQA